MVKVFTENYLDEVLNVKTRNSIPFSGYARVDEAEGEEDVRAPAESQNDSADPVPF